MGLLLVELTMVLSYSKNLFVRSKHFLINIKKKSIYFFTIATIVIFSTLTVSCSDEFVNRDVAYSIDSENYFNSKSDYDNALVRLTTYYNLLM
jgi:predicted neutral ceramidase superfamily lipid hydrolase